jgi:hypothetical protein
MHITCKGDRIVVCVGRLTCDVSTTTQRLYAALPHYNDEHACMLALQHRQGAHPAERHGLHTSKERVVPLLFGAPHPSSTTTSSGDSFVGGLMVRCGFSAHLPSPPPAAF